MWAAAVALVLLAGCSRVDDRSSVAEPYLPGDTAVAFDLEPLQSDASQQWIGIYNSHGKVARFRIELGPAKSTADFSTTFGQGELIPEPGSDSSVLLADLQKMLQAKTVHQPPPKKTSVPFTYVNIGDNFSQVRGGELSGDSPGNWTAMKLFFGKVDREAQVFLDMNAKIKKGQFSIKDGDLVLAELSKVL
jgi:hypothetical protein